MSGTPPPPAAGPGAGRDPGVQPVRTRLAWRRTTLTFALVLVLAVRKVAVSDAAPAGAALMALTALVWVGFLVLAHRRIAALGASEPPAPGRGTVLAAFAAVLLAALLGVALVAVPE